MRYVLLVWLGLSAATWAAPTSDSPPAAPPLAWARCQQSPQTYAERNYWWLGELTLRLRCQPASRPRAVALLWGSKNDARGARLTVGGATFDLAGGGYDGFRWLEAPLPNVAPGPLDLTLAAPPTGRAAFVAEVRLLGGPDTPTVDPTPATWRMTVSTSVPSTSAAEAFPAMRALWDREPAYTGPAQNAGEAAFRLAERRARLAAEGLYRCRRYVDGWLAHADPVSGLIPRNLGESRDLWNGRDSAADNYPFMVLTCALTDRALFDGRMRDILAAETRLTRRLDRLGDQFRFSTQSFWHDRPDLERMVFDNAEYVKDGLIPLTEWLGPSPWSERMIGLVEDIWKNAAIDTPFGRLPTLTLEVNGDLMQACARLYWFTGQARYLDWGCRLADYYLLGDHHPSRTFDQLRFADHDCEIINGLSELYLA